MQVELNTEEKTMICISQLMTSSSYSKTLLNTNMAKKKNYAYVIEIRITCYHVLHGFTKNTSIADTATKTNSSLKIPQSFKIQSTFVISLGP